MLGRHAEPSRERVVTTNASGAVRNVGWTWIHRGAQAAVAVAWLFTVPKLLGPSAYGAFVFLFSAMVLGQAIGDLGTHVSFAYHVSAYEARQDHMGVSRLFSGFLGLKLLVAVTCGATCAALVYSMRFPSVGGLASAATGLALLLSIATDPLYGLLYGRGRIRPVVARETVTSIVKLGLVPTLYGLWSVPGAALGLVASALATLPHALWASRPLPPSRFQRETWVSVWQHLKVGLPAAPGRFIWILLGQGGALLLASGGGPAREVAVFGIAAGIWTMVASLLASPSFSLIPGLTRLLVAGQRKKAGLWLGALYKWQVIATVLCGAIFVLLGKQILRAALGLGFEGAWAAALVGTIAIPFFIYYLLATSMAAAAGTTMVNLESHAVVAGAFCVTSVALAPGYGATGCMVGIVVGSVCGAVYAGVRVHCRCGPAPSPWPGLAVAVLGALGIGAVFGLRHILSVGIGLGLFCVYLAAALFVTRLISAAELRELIGLLRSGSPSVNGSPRPG